jgi:hypothetical protein
MAECPRIPDLQSSQEHQQKENASQAAFFTRPERMQDVQTRNCLRAPFTNARTLRKFGFQRRRRTLLAWLMTFP